MLKQNLLTSSPLRSSLKSTEKLLEPSTSLLYSVLKNNVATPGVFDLDVDSNGRWSVEKFKGLIFQIERDANAIAQQTRRGKGNFILCSADVASALTMGLVFSITPLLSTLTSTLMTPVTPSLVYYKVSIAYTSIAYAANVSNNQYYVAGYKGTSPYDAGLFYCPYVRLQMVRSVGQDTFPARMGFKTRYGMVANPFAEGLNQGLGRIYANSNVYYRRVQ